jgi:hypothetical protein
MFKSQTFINIINLIPPFLKEVILLSMSDAAITEWEKDKEPLNRVIEIEGIPKEKLPYIILERYVVVADAPANPDRFSTKHKPLKDDESAIVVEDGCEFIITLRTKYILCTAKRKPSSETLASLSHFLNDRKPPLLTTNDKPYQYVIGGKSMNPVNLEAIARHYDTEIRDDDSVDTKICDGVFVTITRTGTYVLDGPAQIPLLSSVTKNVLAVMDVCPALSK